MTDAHVSDGYRRRADAHPDHLAELSWMREHHRSPAWIDAALDHDLSTLGRPGAALCHAIGEHLQPAPDSPLGEFVVYDILRPRAVLAQLDLLTPGCPHNRWTDALRAFVETALDAGWSGRTTADSPRPMLYVTRSSSTVGEWVDMTRPERHVEELLRTLPGRHDDLEWTVQARIGYYDVYPLVQPELWTMHTIGQGIDRHGEAFAAYAEFTFQQGMSEHDFEARYRGHVRSLDEVVHDQAEARGWLQAIAAVNAVEGLAGAVSLDMEALTRHIFTTGFAYEPGREGFHIFGPPRL